MTEPPLPEAGSALFLDFDGTLVDIAARPELVRVSPGLCPLLGRLSSALAGALAVLTGRPVAQIDDHLAPLRLPAAGVHGVERRGSDGQWHRLPCPDLESVRQPLQHFCDAHPGLRLEAKLGALALHYRQAPHLEGACLDVMQQYASGLDGMALMRGKQVVELKPRAAGKDRALQAFMDEPPFAGRRPWFLGDDVTDEAGFEAVQRLGGIAIKVGTGPTAAPYRLPHPAAVQDWLQAARAALERAMELKP